MSEFVNYQKRAVTLPPGCKDLTDVLRPTKDGPWVRGLGQRFRIRKDRLAAYGLVQVESYVARLLANPQEICDLTLKLPDNEATLSLLQAFRYETSAIARFTPDKQHEAATRTFFDQRGIKPVMDHFTSFAGESEAACLLAYPLPPDAPEASTLITEFLRQVHALNDMSALEFQYLVPETGS